MAREKRRGVLESLRQRILRGLESGALEPGMRLPGVRRIGAELDVDPRVAARAYRDLAADGLVEIRDRSGAFVAVPGGRQSRLMNPSADWLAEIVADGVLRGVGAPHAAEALTAAIGTRVVNGVVAAGILDQADGLARELKHDFGINASPLLLDTIGRGEQLPRAVRRAHLLVTTAGTAAPVQRLGERTGKPVVVVAVRPDLLSFEWQSLMRGPVYVVVADPRFEQIIREFVSVSEGAPNVRLLVAGKDDVAAIPPDAPTYVTESARIRLGRTRLPGRLIAPARILSDDSVRDVARLLIEINLAPTRRRDSEPQPARSSGGRR